jgi:hypothetical protein
LQIKEPRVLHFASESTLARQRHAKERRGYRLVNDYARRLKPAAKFGVPDDKADKNPRIYLLRIPSLGAAWH